MSDTSGQEFYQVSWSKIAMGSAKRTVEQLDEPDDASKCVRIIKTLDKMLRHDPLAVGEVRWERGAVEDRIVVLDFVAFPFRVDKLRKFVMVRDCIALSRDNKV